MAQGIIIQRFHVDPDEAYALLKRISQHSNTKMHVLAEDIVRTRRMPGVDDRGSSTS